MYAYEQFFRNKHTTNIILFTKALPRGMDVHLLKQATSSILFRIFIISAYIYTLNKLVAYTLYKRISQSTIASNQV